MCREGERNSPCSSAHGLAGNGHCRAIDLVVDGQFGADGSADHFQGMIADTGEPKSIGFLKPKT